MRKRNGEGAKVTKSNRVRVQAGSEKAIRG